MSEYPLEIEFLKDLRSYQQISWTPFNEQVALQVGACELNAKEWRALLRDLYRQGLIEKRVQSYDAPCGLRTIQRKVKMQRSQVVYRLSPKGRELLKAVGV